MPVSRRSTAYPTFHRSARFRVPPAGATPISGTRQYPERDRRPVFFRVSSILHFLARCRTDIFSGLFAKQYSRNQMPVAGFTMKSVIFARLIRKIPAGEELFMQNFAETGRSRLGLRDQYEGHARRNPCEPALHHTGISAEWRTRQRVSEFRHRPRAKTDHRAVTEWPGAFINGARRVCARRVRECPHDLNSACHGRHQKIKTSIAA